MKFSCDTCGAKYQIEDAKIAGRTATMTCRKCGDEIVVKGPVASDPILAEPLPTSRPPEPHMSETREHASAPAGAFRATPESIPPVPEPGDAPPVIEAVEAPLAAPSVPSPPKVAERWHVAIDDTPVGPLERDEIAAKVRAGVVTRRSLVWRDGLEAWTPLGEIGALRDLVVDEPSRASVPPPLPRASRPSIAPGVAVTRPANPATPPRVSRSSVPPRPSTIPRPVTTARPSLSPRVSKQPAAAVARASSPPVPSNVIPISTRLSASPRRADETGKRTLDRDEPVEVVSASPLESRTEDVSRDGSGAAPVRSEAPAGAALLESLPAVSDPPTATASTSVVPPAPGHSSHAPSLPPTALPARGSFGAKLALAGVIAFGVTLGVIVGRPLLLDEPKVPPPPAPEAAPSTPERRLAEPELVIDTPEEPEAIVEAPAPSPSKSSRSGARTRATKAAPPPELTAAERAMLDRFSGETAANPTGVSVPKSGGEGSSRGEGLTAQQLTAVVGKNRPQLQRCYESAIRGMMAPPSVRMDVDVSVGSSGTVTSVSVRGANVGTLGGCIEQAVRRWRFPTSGAATQTSFPVVFQPGG